MAEPKSSVNVLPSQCGRGPEKMPGWIPVLLGLPALIPLVYAYLSAWWHGRVPTGFLHYETAYYMANARAHFARGFGLLYANPYAPYGAHRIYFQPHIFVLALLERAGLDPGVAFNVFGLAALVFAALVAGRLYEEAVGWRTRAQKIGFVCFFWGGGLIAIASLALGWFARVDPVRAAIEFDFGHGWWMFNFGRNLVLPTEAYYHGVFLLAILMLMRNRMGATLALTALLSLSHPFTGLSLALIVAAYAAVEIRMKSEAASWRLLAGSMAIVVLHVSYYLVFLNRFEEHRVLSAQWREMGWAYTYRIFVPALCLVGYFAITRLIDCPVLRDAFRTPRNRLFAVWFIVVFGLTQHDLVMQSMQPVHFAHGYDWIALFFLGAPALLALIERLLAIRRPAFRTAALGAFLAVMLFDNVFWFGSLACPTAPHHDLSLTVEERDVLGWLTRNATGQAYVASDDGYVNYLTSTYTNVKAWQGHFLNTPHWSDRKKEVQDAFELGRPLAALNPVYYIPLRSRNWIPPRGSVEVYGNRAFVIWLANASRPAGALPR
jgi:hypothetical protein